MSNIFSLSGKVIVVTGGAGLLGKEHAYIIAKSGGTPILLDINEQALISATEYLYNNTGFNIQYYRVDITNEESISKNCKLILEKFGKIDGLVNNAANNPKIETNESINFSRLENFSLDVWNQDIAVGLTGAFLCSKYYGEAISKQGGCILNISSDLGLISPDQRLYSKEGLADNLQPVKPVTYSIVKSGIIGLTKYLSTYWIKQGVRCNAICPGGVEVNQDQDFIKNLCDRIPMGRMAKPNEYHGIVLFLLSEASSYMTGSVISIDGGRTSW